MSTPEKEQKEPFVSRWSRRKQEAREQSLPERSKPASESELAKPLPELPPVDKLSFESDFTGFMDARVDDALRRIALKKLFSDPRFNIKDGLDDYAEDYAALEDLPADLVDKLRHARRTLRGPDPEVSDTPDTQLAETHTGQSVQEQQEPAQLAKQQLDQTVQERQESQPLADAGSTGEANRAPEHENRNR